MAIETEKKYRLGSGQAEAVTASLKELGAEFGGEDFEENILFLGEGFVESGTVLRLRRIGERTVVTFKRKLDPVAAVKNYTEHETEVADFDEMAAIFERLGYRRSLVYEKRRRTWRIGGAEIVLDVLPFGEFMEIEGTLESIAATEILIGAAGFSPEPETYPGLVLKHGTKRGDLIESRFENAS